MIVIWRVPELRPRVRTARSSLRGCCSDRRERKRQSPRIQSTPVVVIDRTISSRKGRIGVLVARRKKHPPSIATVQNEQDRSANSQEGDD